MENRSDAKRASLAEILKMALPAVMCQCGSKKAAYAKA